MHSNQGKLTFCKACGEEVMHVYMSYDSSVSNETGHWLDGHSSIPKNSTNLRPFSSPPHRMSLNPLSVILQEK
jgi:hypothetical protein